MSEFAWILAYALLPVAGNLIGGALAEGTRAPGWVRGAALHAAAGTAIALFGIEIMPRALDTLSTGMIIAAFLAGAFGSVLLAQAISGLQRRPVSDGRHRAYMVYGAIGADLFSDGLMTGVGGAAESTLGLLLAASQAIANIPGGFAAVSNLRDSKVPLTQRALVTIGMIAPVGIAAACGYWLLRDAGQTLQNISLVLVGSFLLLSTVEDVLPEGDAPAPKRWISSSAFAAGFIVFAIMSAGIG